MHVHMSMGQMILIALALALNQTCCKLEGDCTKEMGEYNLTQPNARSHFLPLTPGSFIELQTGL